MNYYAEKSTRYTIMSVYVGVCSLEPHAGPCRAAINRWHYSASTERCETFIYGGCRGNENNFSDEMSCLLFCTDQLTAKSPRVTKC